MPDISKRCPVNGTFELTGRCNLSCKMCLVRVDKKRIEELGLRERTAEEWIDMARQAAEAGTLGLLLTGGEVMLRPDFCEIYEAIAKMGFLLTLYTNATMVTDEIMDVLERYPPHKIGVTMYGASNETYERLCACKNGYDKFVEGIYRLSELPSLFEMRTTIVKDNVTDINAMKEFTRRKFGKDKALIISRFVTKSIRGGIACAEKCRLTPVENIKLIHNDLTELYEKVKANEIKLPKPEEKLKTHYRNNISEGDYLFENCGAGLNQYTITWDGAMYACELLPTGCTFPFDTNFRQAWEELPEKYPRSRINKRCMDCKYAAFCEACPAIRMAETGDYFDAPEYFCEEAQYFYNILSELEVV